MKTLKPPDDFRHPQKEIHFSKELFSLSQSRTNGSRLTFGLFFGSTEIGSAQHTHTHTHFCTLSHNTRRHSPCGGSHVFILLLDDDSAKVNFCLEPRETRSQQTTHTMHSTIRLCFAEKLRFFRLKVSSGLEESSINQIVLYVCASVPHTPDHVRKCLCLIPTPVPSFPPKREKRRASVCSNSSFTLWRRRRVSALLCCLGGTEGGRLIRNDFLLSILPRYTQYSDDDDDDESVRSNSTFANSSSSSSF